MAEPCPRCGYRRLSTDVHVVEGVCPACGIAIEKWLKRQQQSVGHNESETEPQEMRVSATRLLSIRTFRELFLSVPDKVDAVSFFGRCAIYVLLFFWGCSFLMNGLAWEGIMNSFMHNINLPFHEFGHFLFQPFGRFMMILGGSLFQVLFPFILCLIFSLKQRDNFAASVMLWWCGQSYIDLSPYIADATYRGLPLILGMGESAHDWGNLLRMTDMLEYDYIIARGSFLLGAALMLLSFIWGAYLLYRQYRGFENRLI
ncbi:MAG: hypothetical protein KDI30_06320 [Pseudomonadales bacterium]|nr:hypothetical protein [Pseudomonadales bacterium]